MHIKSLFLKNFRNYEERLFLFGPQLNLISGPNARGKTTILEALYLLATGSSFRATHLKELIRHGESEFVVAITFQKHGIEQTLRFVYSTRTRKIFHNTTAHTSPTGLLGVLPCVLMIPDDVSMVKGQPKLRRHYLDLQLAQADPLYVYYLQRYQRALLQRNALLKARSLSTIDIWESEMAQSGGYLTSKRLRLLNCLQKSAGHFFSQISGEQETLGLDYRSRSEINLSNVKSSYLEAYYANRSKELSFGASLIGPHRDDFQIFVDGKEARYFSSEGQQKSCVAGLRLAEWQHLQGQAGITPLFLIDDLGVSLDVSRRSRLFSCFEGTGQVFVTSTEPQTFGNRDLNLIDLKD